MGDARAMVEEKKNTFHVIFDTFGGREAKKR
jgi:hypothetical protein